MRLKSRHDQRMMSPHTRSRPASWLALAGAAVVLAPLGIWGDGVARAAVPDPAPALTQQQLAQLQTVTSWDFEYTGSKTVKYSGSGGAYEAASGLTVSNWDFASDLTWSVHAKGTVS